MTTWPKSSRRSFLIVLTIILNGEFAAGDCRFHHPVTRHQFQPRGNFGPDPHEIGREVSDDGRMPIILQFIYSPLLRLPYGNYACQTGASAELCLQRQRSVVPRTRGLATRPDHRHSWCGTAAHQPLYGSQTCKRHQRRGSAGSALHCILRPLLPCDFPSGI